jgi:hypothetical protein
MSEERSNLDSCAPLRSAAFHISMCRACKVRTGVCNRVLFGGQPPTCCPYALEHVVGDQNLGEKGGLDE